MFALGICALWGASLTEQRQEARDVVVLSWSDLLPGVLMAVSIPLLLAGIIVGVAGGELAKDGSRWSWRLLLLSVAMGLGSFAFIKGPTLAAAALGKGDRWAEAWGMGLVGLLLAVPLYEGVRCVFRLVRRDPHESDSPPHDEPPPPQEPRRPDATKRGWVRVEDIETARKVQQQTGQNDLGKVLISLGIGGEREVLMEKAQGMGFPFVDLERADIHAEAIEAVPERIARNHSVIPVRKEGTNLWLAMANPANLAALDDVRQCSGCRVHPVMAVPSDVKEAIRRYYGDVATKGANPEP